MVRNVALGILGRVVVLVGIYAEYGKVARVTGPHPVVRFAAELTDRLRGSPYQAHVLEHLVHEQVIFVAAVKTFHLGTVFAVFRCLDFYFLRYFVYGLVPLVFRHVGGEHFLYFVGDVFHAYEKLHRKSFGGQFLVV